MQEILTVAGTGIGLLSLLIAAIQTKRLSKLKEIRVKSLRASLRNARSPVVETDRLLKNRTEYGITNNGAISKLRSIHSNSCGLVTSIFQDLSLAERSYDQKRLEFYVSTGLITSQWFWQKAAMFIDDSKVLRMPDLPVDSPDSMTEADQPNI